MFLHFHEFALKILVMEMSSNASDMFMVFLQPRESSPIAKPVSKLLLFYLEFSSDRLLTRCYPKVNFFNL